ncbi:MAG: hypothetical protein CK424_03505 [Legionella sp.]|nr:MAG: hypothetical protein CK424_03505 [Legionella sp.]
MQLSPYHKIFYYEWMLDPLSSKYNVVFDQTLSSNLDIKKLKKTLHRFISDYLIMNSHVMHKENELFWVLNDEIIELEFFDAPYDPEQIFNYISAPFNLEAQALYRFALFTESDGCYRFILVVHHLLIDGNSFDTLINEISNYYNSPTYKAHHSLLEQSNILKETNQLFDLQLKSFDSQYQRFWDEKLAHIEPIDLRWAKSESNIDKIAEHRFDFDEKTTKKLAQITSQLDITTYLYGQCIFAILLHKYTNKNDIAFSYPITIKGGLPLISGACVNTNVTVYELNTATTILDLFQQNKNFVQSLKALGHNASHYPVNKIIHNEQKNLLQVMFAQTSLKDIAFHFSRVKTVKINSEFNIDLPTKIIFESETQGNKLNFRVRYNTIKIDETILTYFIRQYKHLFVTILDDLCSGITNKKINHYPILSKGEYNQIVYQWNTTSPLSNSNKTIHALFEEQVLKTPDNIALVYKNTQLTYTHLNERSNQLAHYLRTKHRVKGDDLIALYLDRSEHMLISILGVLKAGGAYVPIDVTYPEKRIRYMLDDIGMKVLITNKHNLDHIKSISLSHEQENYPTHHDLSIVSIDSDDIQHHLNQYITSNPDLNTQAHNLVYVMYTSGTIGMPKGVMLEHCSVTPRVLSMIEKSGIHAKSNYLFKTNYVFDVSFSDIFMTLLSGGSLYITKSVFDIEEIGNLIATHDINVCHFVPSQLEAINDYLFSKNLFSKLQIINVSGEKFHKSLIYDNTNIKYVNYYGPTETGEVTADITDFKNQVSDHPKLDTIGHPLTESTLYILDEHLNPLPIGAIGELYVGGTGLARAYLNLPELTQKLFIPNPFQNLAEQNVNNNNRLYKTGDLVRYLSNGNIEYIGRGDNQVKIRGFRVELSEIETKLCTYPGIKQAVVLPQEQITSVGINKKYLVAYYVSHTALDENIMLEHLSQELPDYMLPSLFIYLEHLPLTVNGKLNIRALPAAYITTNRDTYVAPKNELEKTICALYADALKLPAEQIGINDNFFKLGGNSISAIHLAFKLQHHFDITVSDIFEYKTPAKISQFIPVNNINLFDRLEQIKWMYSKLAIDKNAHKAIKHERTLYQQQVNSFRLDNTIKSNWSVLLTGATGYLGCHLLYELLSTTDHSMYLPIRAPSKEAADIKLCEKFKYYFDIDLNLYKDRIHAFPSDLSKTNLGVDKSQYEALINNISSIIHSAALVKHYGSNSEFYAENVQSTINLLELSRLTENKDFHYISTIGVFTTTLLDDSGCNIFTEESINESQANFDNVYTKTKYQGEQVTLQYRDHGIKTNIYRIGNLAINSVTRKTQENIEDNAFFQRVKTILKLGILPQELSELEISPVDCTATAITLLFNQAQLYNQIHHVFHPRQCDLYELYRDNKKNNLKRVPFPIFIDTIKNHLKNSENTHEIELFILHQWGLYSNTNNFIPTIIFQDKTTYLLDQLNFKWPKITRKMLPK